MIGKTEGEERRRKERKRTSKILITKHWQDESALFREEEEFPVNY